MTQYPATFDARQPERFDRAQVAMRLLVLLVMAVLAGAIGWAFGVIWLGVPVLAAVLISQKGAARYFEEAPNNIIKWLGLIAGFYAWLSLLTDRLPGDPPQDVRFDVQPEGTPSVGSALLRIIMVIPHAIVLSLIGIVAAVLTLIAAVYVVVGETYPASIYSFLRGHWRWYARVLAYLASLTDAYPPFAFDTEGEATESPAPSGV
jgi:hypothetical protein